MSIDRKTLATLALARLAGFGPVTFKRLADSFGGPEEILAADAEAWKEAGARVRKKVSRYGAAELFALAESEMKAVAASGAHVVGYFDGEYPEALRAISDPPIVLYVKGTLPSLPCLAVVGSRDASPYGLRTARRFGKEFGAAGVCVVSGLALGIDGAAHEGALEGRGATVAVLGGGLNKLHPRTHAGLAKKIAAAGGAVVSEFPMDEGARAEYFPYRNRVISGFSRAVIVVEARRQSGALITADAALAQGRDVYVVPGNLEASRSTGTNELLSQGARPALSPAQVLEDLGWEAAPAELPAEAPAAGRKKEDSLLRSFGDDPLHVDEIVEKSGWPASRVLSSLTRLEIEGRVSRLPGRYFSRKP